MSTCPVTQGILECVRAGYANADGQPGQGPDDPPFGPADGLEAFFRSCTNDTPANRPNPAAAEMWTGFLELCARTGLEFAPQLIKLWAKLP